MRKLLGVTTILLLIASSFVGYGRWTRRNPPSFSVGGSFESMETASPAAEAPPTVKGATTRSGGKTSPDERQTPPDEVLPTSSRTPSYTTSRPAPGTYRYEGSGSERVAVGANCAWDIDDIVAVVKHGTGDRVIEDWTYAPEHQERHLMRYKPDGVYTTFVGSAVTCFGVRHTDESSYDPPALRIPLPLRVGRTWTAEATAGERHETIRGRVAEMKRIRVPAGRFQALRIEIEADLSGSEKGTFRETLWFAPSLGMGVKAIAHTDVVSGNARFTSTVRRSLAALP